MEGRQKIKKLSKTKRRGKTQTKASHCWRSSCWEIANRPSHRLYPLPSSVRDMMRLWVPRINLKDRRQGEWTWVSGHGAPPSSRSPTRCQHPTQMNSGAVPCWEPGELVSKHSLWSESILTTTTTPWTRYPPFQMNCGAA